MDNSYEKGTEYISTVYGQMNGHTLTEIPSGYRYIVKSVYLKLKPTWFNLGLDWRDGTYDVIKAFEERLDKTKAK
jgi:hypothetical protein